MGMRVCHCGNPAIARLRKRENQQPETFHGFDGKFVGAIVQNSARFRSSLVLLVVV